LAQGTLSTVGAVVEIFSPLARPQPVADHLDGRYGAGHQERGQSPSPSALAPQLADAVGVEVGAAANRNHGDPRDRGRRAPATAPGLADVAADAVREHRAVLGEPLLVVRRPGVAGDEGGRVREYAGRVGRAGRRPEPPRCLGRAGGRADEVVDGRRVVVESQLDRRRRAVAARDHDQAQVLVRAGDRGEVEARPGRRLHLLVDQGQTGGRLGAGREVRAEVGRAFAKIHQPTTTTRYSLVDGATAKVTVTTDVEVRSTSANTSSHGDELR
jgi:hypothetical protein